MEGQQLTIFERLEEVEIEAIELEQHKFKCNPKSSGDRVQSNLDPTDDVDHHRRIEGYSPGHPWYYKLGGEIIEVENIPPKSFRQERFDPIRRRNSKPNPSLEIQLKNARKNLEEDVARYKTLIEQGNACCSESDLRNGYDWKFNLSLVYNHISYDKGLVALLEKMTSHRNRN